ncbi:MAG: S8 family serine peptidase [Bdellovibrionales bacterium]
MQFSFFGLSLVLILFSFQNCGENQYMKYQSFSELSFQNEREILAELENEDSARVIIITSVSKPGKQGLMGSSKIPIQNKLISISSKPGRLDINNSLGPNAFAANINQKEYSSLQTQSNVLSIIPNKKFHLSLIAQDPNSNMPIVTSERGGDGTMIVIIDSGIQRDHPDFVDTDIIEACFSDGSCNDNGSKANSSSGPNSAKACAFIEVTDDKLVSCSHGTHVAGIASGKNGIAPKASIAAINVFGYDEDDRFVGSLENILSALNYVDEVLSENHNISSINMSLGFTDPEWGPGDCSNGQVANAMRQTGIFDRLHEKNILVVAAAGNDGFNKPSKQVISYPACEPMTFSVGALSTNPEILADFSNFDSSVDIVTHGTEIRSAILGSRYAALDGTSMATPIVSGAVALIKEKHSYSNNLTDYILKESANKEAFHFSSKMNRLDIDEAIQLADQLVGISNIRIDLAGEKIIYAPTSGYFQIAAENPDLLTSYGYPFQWYFDGTALTSFKGVSIQRSSLDSLDQGNYQLGIQIGEETVLSDPIRVNIVDTDIQSLLEFEMTSQIDNHVLLVRESDKLLKSSLIQSGTNTYQLLLDKPLDEMNQIELIYQELD